MRNLVSVEMVLVVNSHILHWSVMMKIAISRSAQRGIHKHADFSQTMDSVSLGKAANFCIERNQMTESVKRIYYSKRQI